MTTDDDLRARLVALEARTPHPAGPPPLPAARRRSRRLAPIALAPALLILIVATAAAGGAVVANLAHGYPGVENPGQPLAGANLECMSPPQAAAYLTARGYTNVVWQVETGPVGGKSGGSVQQATPPDHGYVVPGAILGDGQLIMVVDLREGATGVGACFGAPRP